MVAYDLMPSREGAGFPPRSLADVVGHAATVGRIIGRFKKNRHDTPLLLYGPDGAGKETVARMYARALLCTGNRIVRSSPCERCSACASGVENNFDYVKIDARAREGKEKLRGWLRAASIGPRHVLVIDHFDQAVPEFVDALLKPLEDDQDPISPTTIILLAKDLDGVRQAGQSRCDVERLWRLTDTEMAELSERAMRALDIECESNDALRTLVLGSRGLPSLAIGALRAAGPGVPVDAAGLRSYFSADWADAAGHYWLDLLSGAGPAAGSSFACEDDIIGGRVIVRLRWVWSGLRSFLRDSTVRGRDEPALYFLDETILRRLEDLISQKASEAKVPRDVLWSAIAKLLLEEEYADVHGHELLKAQIANLVGCRR